MGTQHTVEINTGNRFSFGENWTRFLTILDDKRIRQAEKSLCEMLKVKDLKGKRFLDIGSGSGLFSLAARKLGATVYSFDYDPDSVACTQELKRRYFPKDLNWKVEEGSVLDKDYLQGLGEFDVVYSWGVLHHTGEMTNAFENAASRVKKGGSLFIAIYNEQDRASKLWLKTKEAYNHLPSNLRWLVLWPATLRLWGPTTIRDIVKGKPFHTWKHYSDNSMRGMSPWRDVVDWVGGLPFEVATPEYIFHYFQKLGFSLEELKTCDGHGCNEFVFKKIK